MDKNLEESVNVLGSHIGKAFGMYVDECIQLVEDVKGVVGVQKVDPRGLEPFPEVYEKFKLFTERIYAATDMVSFIKEGIKNRKRGDVPNPSDEPSQFDLFLSKYYIDTGVDIREMISQATDSEVIQHLENQRQIIADYIRRYDNYFQQQK